MTLKQKLVAGAVLTAFAGITTPAHAGHEAYIGELMLIGFNFCPRGTAEANGQLLPISSNTALFSLLGTTYGGDGRTNFALPDLRGRAPIHAGQGRGLPATVQGEMRGGSSVARSAGTPDPAQTLPTLTMRYCIATDGIYPSRN